jgi:branched-chain amino acid transport system substrate-binding protein
VRPRAATLIVGALLACACNGPAAVAGQPPSDKILIAAELPLVSDTKPINDAIALAIRDKRTIGRYQLAYQAFDDSLVGFQDRARAEQNVKQMIQDQRILAVVGPYNSSVAEVAIPLTNQAGLVVLSPSNTEDCLTSPTAPCPQRSTPNNYFRLAATDTAQARAAARFALQKLGLKNFAVLSEVTLYGQQLADSFSAELTAGGGHVVLRRQYSPNLNDYTDLLHEALKAGAEAVFVGGSDVTGACRIRADMAAVFPAGSYLMGGDGLYSQACISAAGMGADDHLLVMISDSQPSPDNKVYRELVSNHIPPNAYVVPAYDCAEIVIDAIDRAIKANGGRYPTRSQVLAALAATTDFHGASGTFTFKPNGDTANPLVSVYRVEGGRYTFWQNAA